MITSIPLDIIQGTTVTWTRAYGDYAPTAYGITYEFRSQTGSLTVSATDTNGAWLVTLSKAQTDALSIGVYNWQCFALSTDTQTRLFVDNGFIEVKPDLSRIPAIDPLVDQRSSARKRLATYRAMLENVAYIKTLDPSQIEALEKIAKNLEWDVKREEDGEKLKRNGYPTRKIYTRFV